MNSITILLEEQLQLLHDICHDFGEADFNKTPPTGKWSARDNLAHLVRYQLIAIDRFNRIQLETKPMLARYVAEADQSFNAVRQLDRAQLIKQYSDGRQQLYAKIEVLKVSGKDLVGVHPRLGEMHIRQWLQFFALHESHHIFTIFELRA